MSSKSHWEKIYKEKSPHEVSWTQEIPSTSINFFSDFKIQKDDPIIDVGGGESKFVDYLIDNGYENISVLDISENAEFYLQFPESLQIFRKKWNFRYAKMQKK